ncbi:hypothetical protein ANCCEY_11525 [Ancylostoma ceylanicum]|uniref:Beta-lactamase-related domain-containing protein n=1 Tax=Ancylostoma ceylanicum TaxID=53326 RepID=A0A0D6LDW4_9BILA|nr:hypothetical protein ANCCEY_11525 [Ancylostoma ceylanicum]
MKKYGVKDIVPYNDPKILELPLISCMGIGTAEGFAKAVRQVFEKKLISEEVWNLLSRPTTTEEDIVLSSVKSFGHGFTYEQHPVHKGVIIVMLRNGLRAGDDGAAEYEEISRTIYQIIKGSR